ncbi:hypothetical protein ACFE04_025372 [Oxalis oulophora]
MNKEPPPHVITLQSTHLLSNLNNINMNTFDCHRRLRNMSDSLIVVQERYTWNQVGGDGGGNVGLSSVVRKIRTYVNCHRCSKQMDTILPLLPLILTARIVSSQSFGD